MPKPRRWTVLLVIAVLAGCTEEPTDAGIPGSPSLSTGEGCGQRANVLASLLLECVTLDGVRSHLTALQAIADANFGTRVSGSAGYDRSVEYVVGKLTGAGYDVTVQEFQFEGGFIVVGSALEQVSPPPAGAIAHVVMRHSGNGDVTAPVSVLAAPPADDSPGCDASDFAGFPAGNIALISRGTCSYAIKVTNADAAGAIGVVIYNNVAGAIDGDLGSTFTLDIPVTTVTQAVGQELAATPGLVLRLMTDTQRGTATSYNVLAETRSGNPDNVIMVGGHLDAVRQGPGINDNGSGIAAVLETALQMARVRPANRVRFAFWGAEESGLVGSRYYVDQLSVEALNRIVLYLNFDMIASPNHGFFVYDGDDSDGYGAGPGPAGSDEIEKLFEEYYARAGRVVKGVDIGGRSDHSPFVDAGIPVGGIFTGAEFLKTPEEAALWGGTAGEQYDPCYHQACDTYDNVNLAALDVNADAVAFATIAFAMSTERVNGIRGRGVIKARGTFELTGTTEGMVVHGMHDR